jgi:hypothetical protein
MGNDVFKRVEPCMAASRKRGSASEGAAISLETIVMDFKPVRIVACEARPNYILWIRFDDGVEGEVDLSDLVGRGVFKAWENPEFWKSVKVDPESETVCWGEEIDLDPYVLKEDVLKTKKPRHPFSPEKN